MKQFSAVVVGFAVFTALALIPATGVVADEPVEAWRVIDGGTLWLQTNGEWQRADLAWIDAPAGAANRPFQQRLSLPLSYAELRGQWVRWIRQTESYGERATKTLEAILSGTESLEFETVPQALPPTRSGLTRSTLQVSLEADGRDVALRMVERGWAIPFAHQTIEPPGHWEDLLKAVVEAMGECVGMWESLLESCQR